MVSERRRASRVWQALALAAVAVAFLPGCLQAGSTGSTALLTPQGSGGGTANGDYISSDPGGLDTFYRYYVEVPPSLSRLVIEIFDADVGAGGATEDTSGRDRERTSYNSSVRYSLVAPSGTARTPRFTTGSTTAPTGADNAWLAVYDSNLDNFRDNFGTVAYTNNDGGLTWGTNWIETGDDANANAGQILITGGELRLRDNGGAASTIERQANLSAAGFSTATLSFNFRTQNTEAGDQFRVEVSGNGGGSWTTLETFTGAFGASSRSYNISAFIAANTRVRFIEVNGYTDTDSFFVDNFQILESATAVQAGHWELRVDMSSAITTGDDINAIGIRAHDGTSGSGGTEVNVYYDSHNQHGVNPPNSGTTSRSYDFYPYITSGCSASKNDFDYDSNSGTVGSMSFTSRNGSFTQSYPTGSHSTNDAWRRDTFTGWTSDTASTGYGIWSADVTITSYLVSGTPNGNYANLYFSDFQAAANPPGTNPTANAFRVYFPTDAGTAPVKPYLEQLLTYGQMGPNPPAAGQTSRFVVTVRLVNPSAQAITFSTPSNVVTSNVPGSGAVYAGSAAVGQGTIVSQPAVGGTGNVVWNPGTLAAGATTILTYRVDITPASAGQRILATATPASGNGTRAQFLDQTGNTSQARATYLAGPICEIGITEGLLTEATVSSFAARAENGAVVVEWQTASEAGTVGFDLYRWDAGRRDYVRLNRELLLGLLHAPQGGTYRFVDEDASPKERSTYLLVEVEAGGKGRSHGPFSPEVEWKTGGGTVLRPYERIAHPPAVSQAIQPVPAGPRSAAAPVITPYPAGIRLAVREPGLYYVGSADIARFFGVSQKVAETMIGGGKIALSRLGEPVAWHPDNEGMQGKGARGLYFYGEGSDSLFTDDGVYHLARGRDLRMDIVHTSPAPAAGAASSFLEALHREQDLLPATVLSPDPNSDYWFWDFLQSGDAVHGVKSFTVDAPGLANGSNDTALTVALQGATATGNSGEHHVAVSLNGTPVGEAQWEGITPHLATFPLPEGLLLETGNQVEVTGLLDDGIPFSVLYVDSVDLRYGRTYQAAADALTFRASSSAGLSVAGFSGSRIHVLDIANPLLPRWIEGAGVAPVAPETEGGTFRVGFFPIGAGARYLAAGPNGVRTPEMQPWQDAGLRSPSRRADVLILTTAALADAAERLADHRRGQGLESLVADVQAVADEFGGGVSSPQAVRRFLTYALKNWQKAPRYIVLAGAGSLDYRDRLGFGGNLLPPLMVRSTGGLFASDNRLADAAGPDGTRDGLPEAAIGRIPVSTAPELDAYVDKIIAYESGADTPGSWSANALLLNDAPDRGADFAAESGQIAALLPAGYTARSIDLGTAPLEQARAELLAGLNEGASLVNYLGHGGLDRLSSAGLLASDDVPALANGNRLPVLTAMTCTVNRFGVPGVPALGELLVKKAEGGAAAVWAPSGLSINAEAGLLAERFYRLASEPDLERLGDLILRSLTEFHGLGGVGSMVDIYNLLGDPALRLRRAATPPPGPATGSGE